MSATFVDLLPLLLENDNTAWSSFYERYQGLVTRFLVNMGVGPRQLDDARQEVFLQVVRYLGSFRSECDIKTWLYTICISVSHRARSRRRLEDRIHAMFGSQGSEPVVSAQCFTESQTMTLLQRGLDALPDGEREVFVLFELEDRSGQEIAKILNIPLGTVWSRHHIAAGRFRAAIEGRQPV